MFNTTCVLHHKKKEMQLHYKKEQRRKGHPIFSAFMMAHGPRDSNCLQIWGIKWAKSLYISFRLHATTVLFPPQKYS
jgi:hypothetical protein